MAIDWSLFRFGKGKPLTLQRHDRTVARDAALEKAYEDVDARDKKRCQVRGTRLVADHVNEWKALERHHLDPKSLSKGRRADPGNILTVSRGCHRLMGSGALIAIDTKGEETTCVSTIAGYQWNRRLVAPGKEPFRLRPMRTKVA